MQSLVIYLALNQQTIQRQPFLNAFSYNTTSPSVIFCVSPRVVLHVSPSVVL